MHGKRPLEIRQHVVAAFGGVVLGNHDVTLYRRKRLARKFYRHGNAEVGARERRRDIAVGKIAHRDFVCLGFGMQLRRRIFASELRVDHRFERLIVHRDQFGGILGQIATLRHRHRHRLTDIAHALDGERPLLDRRLDDRQKRVGELADVFAGQHGPNCPRARVPLSHRSARSRHAGAASGPHALPKCRPAPAGRRHNGRGPTAAPDPLCAGWICRVVPT